MPRYPLLFVILATLLLTGCTGLRLGYRHADTYLTWKADSYFDMDPGQRRDFDARLERLLTWHRYEQLPEYASFVNTALKKAQDSLRRDDIVWFIDGMKARYFTLVDRGINDAAEMLGALAPEQIVALQRQWTRDNRTFVREHELEGRIDARKIARLKRTLTQIEDWTGTLASEQEQKIAVLLENVEHINLLRHQDRIRRQRDFIEILKLRGNRAEFQPRLLAWLRNWEQGRDPEYARLAQEVFEKRIQFYIDVEKLLTPAQRQTAVRRLRNFADDFVSLSKKTSGVTPPAASVVAYALLSCALEGHACVPS